MAGPTSIILVTQGEKFTVERKVIEKSTYIKNMLKNLLPDDEDEDEEDEEDGESEMKELPEIPVEKVSPETLRKVLEWCEHYEDFDFSIIEDEDDEREYLRSTAVDAWDRKFLNVEPEMLQSIILAANFLNIKPLLNSACKVVAEMIRGRSPEEIRDAFNQIINS